MGTRHHYIASFLLVVISLNIWAVPITYLNFKIHQDYYAAVLCENPDQPITVCGGVCYLKKQLPQTEDTEPVSLVSTIDLTVYYHAIEAWSLPPLKAESVACFPYPHPLTSQYVPSPFRPPQG